MELTFNVFEGDIDTECCVAEGEGFASDLQG